MTGQRQSVLERKFIKWCHKILLEVRKHQIIEKAIYKVLERSTYPPSIASEQRVKQMEPFTTFIRNMKTTSTYKPRKQRTITENTSVSIEKW